MKQFNQKEQIRFWTNFKGVQKGHASSSVIFRLTRKYLGKKILDAGAGDGTLATLLSEKLTSAKITAIDLAPQNKIVNKGNCTKLDFPKNSIDTYLATDLIEHLSNKDLISCLKEANRVLVNGG